MDRYNVLIVEDQLMHREAFEAAVNSSREFNLIGSIEDASLCDIVIAKGGVDIIMMDIVTAGGASGIYQAEKIKRENPEIKIIIVTSMPEADLLQRARLCGVEGFWYKDFHDMPIEEAMREVIKGNRVYPEGAPDVTIGKIKSSELGNAELLVLKELTLGLTNDEIAEKLFISPRTVQTHIRNILAKTGLKNRVELAIVAGKTGIVVNLREGE